jgi:hypothetical protein
MITHLYSASSATHPIMVHLIHQAAPALTGRSQEPAHP